MSTFDRTGHIEFHTCRGTSCPKADKCVRHAAFERSEYRLKCGFWRERLDKGSCDFFAPVVPPPRCDKTIDMFEGASE